MENPPTVEEFKERFPQFVDASEPLIEQLIEEASRVVDDGWLTDDQTPAVMYLTAHWLSLETLAAEGGAGSGVAVGDISSETFGPIKITYATSQSVSNVQSSGTSEDLESTYYGKRYLDLRGKNFPAILVV